MSDFHAQKISKLLSEFDTDLDRGLNFDIAESRLTFYGPNKLAESHSFGLKDFLDLFNLNTLLLSIVASILTYFFHRLYEAIAIGVMATLQVVGRSIQQVIRRNDRKAIEKNYVADVAVIRNGGEVAISSLEVVPGDLLLLKTGSFIAADARLVVAEALRVDETNLSATTSTPIDKNISEVNGENLPIEAQKNMVFGGTYVVGGGGRAIVVRTGEQLVFNQLKAGKSTNSPELESEIEEETKIRYRQFRIVGAVLGGVMIATAWITSIRTGKIITPEFLFFIGISFVIGSTPESIISILRSILVRHLHEISKMGFALRRLSCIENINNMTTICVDQLERLMPEEMTISDMFVDGEILNGELLEDSMQRVSFDQNGSMFPVISVASQIFETFPWLILVANKCFSESRYEREQWNEHQIDNSLELIAMDIGFDLEKYETSLQKVREITSNSCRSFLFNSVENERQYSQFTFGTVDGILSASSKVALNGVTESMSREEKEFTEKVARAFASDRKTVFGVAYKSFDRSPSSQAMKENLTFLGLVAFKKTGEEALRNSIEECKEIDLRIICTTDRDVKSASSLAFDLRLTESRDSVVSGEEFAMRQNDEDLRPIANTKAVYSGLTSEQKFKLLQQFESTTGFWGWSLKELEVMKKSDISFSSKEAFHLVQQNADLLDLNFGGLYGISRLKLYLGQSIENVRSSIRWLLSCNVAIMSVLCFGTLIHLFGNFPLILELKNLLWLQLLLNMVALIGLGHDEVTEEIGRSKPKKKGLFLSPFDMVDLFVRGLVVAMMTTANFIVVFNETDLIDLAQTSAQTTLLFALLISSFQCHRLPWETLRSRININPRWQLGILLCGVLQLASIYLPSANAIFGTTRLSIEWQWIVPLSLLLLFPMNFAHADQTNFYKRDGSFQ